MIFGEIDRLGHYLFAYYEENMYSRKLKFHEGLQLKIICQKRNKIDFITFRVILSKFKNQQLKADGRTT